MEQAMRRCPCPICASYSLFISLYLSLFFFNLPMHYYEIQSTQFTWAPNEHMEKLASLPCLKLSWGTIQEN